METARKLGEWVLADDSGLEVDALGAPQACTRPALPGKVGRCPQQRAAPEETRRSALEQRGAQFRCVMALASPDEEVEFSEGSAGV